MHLVAKRISLSVDSQRFLHVRDYEVASLEFLNVIKSRQEYETGVGHVSGLVLAVQSN
jgi:hypothetical protein